MNAIAQRIALAELCGINLCGGCWHEIDPDCCCCGDSMAGHGYWNGHGAVPMGCTCGYYDAEKRKAKEPQCPNYLFDYNAVEQLKENMGFEKTKDAYYWILHKYCDRTPHLMAFVKAEQWCEAFLVLSSRWVEEKTDYSL